jgi:hypothetical protein
MSLSLAQLLSITATDKKMFKGDYVIDTLKQGKGEDEGGEYLSFSAIVVGGEQPRRPTIHMYAEKVDPTASVKVGCTCAYFKYRLSNSLYTNGATDSKVERGDIPDRFRSDQKVGLCPHLLKLAETVLYSNNTEARRLREQSRDVTISDRLKRLT